MRILKQFLCIFTVAMLMSTMSFAAKGPVARWSFDELNLVEGKVRFIEDVGWFNIFSLIPYDF